ncbi:MAG: hypothetical protein Q605_AUC00816G0002 [Actinomyces urogenitalis DORA_12]|uniref:Uncharacterized protein n=1 Tax=Actinomyces urogenitalis DORA_12 TaxID=1403939 RepID=W1VFI3_9ACTO|nr:MAG: hypothetical protein Q605_AUC00816G0002 [Actinomyces urogenitalis DORA_12]
MPVGGVVEDGDAVTLFSHVDPAVGADLVSGGVPRGVLVGRTLDVPELHLRGGHRGHDIHREGELEQLHPLVPVNVEAELNLLGAGPQADLLAQ